MTQLTKAYIRHPDSMGSLFVKITHALKPRILPAWNMLPFHPISSVRRLPWWKKYKRYVAHWDCCVEIKKWCRYFNHVRSRVVVKVCHPWWRHQMKLFSALLALCAGISPVTGEFPSQGPVTRTFDAFCDLHLNKQLSKQSRRWWLDTPSCSLWRHRNGYPLFISVYFGNIFKRTERKSRSLSSTEAH